MFSRLPAQIPALGQKRKLQRMLSSYPGVRRRSVIYRIRKIQYPGRIRGLFRTAIKADRTKIVRKIIYFPDRFRLVL